MFSSRVPATLASNRFAQAVDRARAGRRPLLDLTESNPTKAGFTYPSDLLAPLGDATGLEYQPLALGLLEAREAVSVDYLRRGIHVSPDRIALTASSSESYSLLFKILCDPGDEVLVPRPSYPLFEHLTRLEGVRAKPYDLDYHGAWAIDIASLVRQWSDRTKAVLIVSPNNPTGSFVKQDELAAIASECAARGAAIIADEVFADFDLGKGGTKRAGVPLACPDSLVFALGGLSKTVGLPQLKLGWIAVGGPDPAVAQALERLELVCDMYLSVSTPVQLSLARLLEGAAGVRTQILRRILENDTLVRRAVSVTSGCRVLTAEGGWYAVLQVPTYCPEEELVLKLIEHDGVLVHPGYFFDFPRESFLIASLLTAREIFAEGVSRLLRHFDCKT